MTSDGKMSFNCPKCSCRLKAQLTTVGKKTKCPKCQTSFTIPNATTSSQPGMIAAKARHMTPYLKQSDRWQIAAQLYQDNRMRLIPGQWSKQEAYPVIDGMCALSAEELFELLDRITRAEESGADVRSVIHKIEDELRRVADTATGNRVRPQ